MFCYIQTEYDVPLNRSGEIDKEVCKITDISLPIFASAAGSFFAIDSVKSRYFVDITRYTSILRTYLVFLLSARGIVIPEKGGFCHYT